MLTLRPKSIRVDLKPNPMSTLRPKSICVDIWPKNVRQKGLSTLQNLTLSRPPPGFRVSVPVKVREGDA